MKKENITIAVCIKLDAELTDTEKALRDKAIAATYRSYSPYSHFSVGAALELADGTIICGSNQENAAYPSGLCAERTAMFYANASHPDAAIKRLCITARGTDGLLVAQPISPCGACRQSLLEAETRYGNDIEVMLYGSEKTYVLRSIKDLLPLSFSQEDLDNHDK